MDLSGLILRNEICVGKEKEFHRTGVFETIVVFQAPDATGFSSVALLVTWIMDVQQTLGPPAFNYYVIENSFTATKNISGVAIAESNLQTKSRGLNSSGCFYSLIDPLKAEKESQKLKSFVETETEYKRIIQNNYESLVGNTLVGCRANARSKPSMESEAPRGPRFIVRHWQKKYCFRLNLKDEEVSIKNVIFAGLKLICLEPPTSASVANEYIIFNEEDNLAITREEDLRSLKHGTKLILREKADIVTD
jgi:hypothetical protein